MENQTTKQNIVYFLNNDENTSFVINCIGKLKNIFIPRSINHGTKEYEVIGILEGAFEYSEIEFIQFANDSKLRTIDYHAFFQSSITSIRIPSSVTSIGEGAFHLCKQLEVIEIPSDSKLQTIGKDAFSFSSIKSIRIPSSVTSIEKNAFIYCYELEVIEIPNDSKLQTIEKNAFSSSKLKKIRIPSELVELKEGWCDYTLYLNEIQVSPKNPRYCCFDEKTIIGKMNVEECNYNCFVFSVRNINHIKIPNFIEHICSYSFDNCKQLELIEISNDSKLQTIEKNAFSNSGIKSFRIPSELVELKEGWCNNTLYLTKIEVSPNNPRYLCYEDKMIIGKTNIEECKYDCLVFCVRDIKRIKIPNFIEHICSHSFDNCKQLEVIDIPDDSKLQTIDKEAFYCTIIKKIKIPASVTIIGNGAFSLCKLEVIEIPNDSKLQIIDKDAFSSSKVKKIRIPSSVTTIRKGAFCDCGELESIEIPDDSKLQTIGKDAFSFSSINSFVIPSSVTKIGEDAFDSCEQLQIIEINNAELISVYQAIGNCENLLLMVPFHSSIHS